MTLRLIALALAATFGAAPYAAAQGMGGATSRVDQFLDALNRSLTYLGEKSEGLIAPKLAPIDEYRVDPFSGLSKVTRKVSENHPVRPGVNVSISNEFGAVRIQGWDNPVVKVEAVITAGADQPDAAAQALNAVEVAVTEAADSLDIRTRIPDAHGLGAVAIEVNYVVMAPRDANLSCVNAFGDTSAKGLRGGVSLDSWYGAVELSDLSGPVTVRAQGEFPLSARNLRKGGDFTLRGTQAEFSGVGGALRASNFRGALTLRDLSPSGDADLSNESGPIHVFLDAAADPDVTASALFGDVDVDGATEKIARGSVTLVRVARDKAKQRLALHAAFDSVSVRREGAASAPALEKRSREGAFDRGMELPPVEIAEGQTLRIDAKAVPGDVQVTGVDADRVTVRARAWVKVQSPDIARAALEALQCVVRDEADAVVVQSGVGDDLAAMGCSSYRVDLAIEVPRTNPVALGARSGTSRASGLGAGLVVEQAEGDIAVQNLKGAIAITSTKGGVDAVECEGPLVIHAAQGQVSTRAVYGRQEIECAQGKTLIDAPQGEVWIRQGVGDVRLIAIDGVRGDYDVAVERGGLRLLAAPSSDAAFTLRAENGEIYPKDLTLTGAIRDGVRQFQGQLNNGKFAVKLTVKEGDLFID